MSMDSYYEMLKQSKKRLSRIVSKFKHGIPITEIAEVEGVSKQRIQQILAREGISRKDGGASFRRKKKNERKARLRDKSYIRKYGYSANEYLEIKNLHTKPVLRYTEQRRNANTRGIVWKMNFRQWWSIWIDSGKWGERGRDYGKYVMARFGDKGDYCVGNVHIISAQQNIVDGYKNRNGSRYRDASFLKERNDKMKLLRHSYGLSLKDIAKSFNLTTASVSRIVGPKTP